MTSSALQQPLLTPEGSSRTEHVVTCNGVKGTLSLSQDGDVCYRPLQPRHGFCCCGKCCGGTQHLEHQISSWHIVGAALESPISFRIWYFSPTGATCSNSSSSSKSKSKSKSNVAPCFKLHKTLPFACASGSEASSLVQKVRQATAWQGRDSAPRLVAVINPSSGQGRSAKVFEQQVVPVLEDAAGLTVTPLVTQHAHHATQLVSELDLTAVDMLLFVGGDGTVYEGLQGLLSRPDWDKARLLPIAHIPTGSGNGLAHSCGLRDASTAAFAICKGVISPMDVASVLQPPHCRRYIMLSVVFGMIANLDVNTEPLRWMGDTRFMVGAVWEVMRGRQYSASIAWLPADEAPSSSTTSEASSTSTATSTKATGATGTAAAQDKEPVSASGQAAAPPGSTNSMESKKPQPNKSSIVASSSSVTSTCLPVSCTRVSSVTSVAHERHPGPAVDLKDFPAEGPGLPLLQQLGRLPLIVPQPAAAQSSLPPGWQVWHEPLQLFACVNPPYISAKSRFNPHGALHLGHFNMLMCAGEPGLRGRLQALEVLAKAETGTHTDVPYLIQHKVRAMVFEPRDTGSYLQLDGEVIPSSPIFMEVHAGLIRVVVSPAHPEEPAADHSRYNFC